MQVLRITAVCLLAACAAALPVDKVVPETQLVATAATHSAAAKKIQALLQAGNNTDECKTLAESEIDQLTTSISGTQTMLDELPKGDHCEALYEEQVKAAEEELLAAQNAAKEAAQALEDATSAPVQLQPQAYSYLKTGDCGWIKQDPGYLSAHAAYEAAVKADAEAKAKVETEEKELQDAKDEAAKQEHECECEHQQLHATEWEKANANNDANEEAWKQAHNMLCVLAHTEYSDCTFDPLPTLEKPTLPENVATAECASEPGAPAPGTGFDGDYIAVWAMPAADHLAVRAPGSPQYSFCGVVEDGRTDYLVAHGQDGFTWVPYFKNGQINTGCDNSCNNGVGIDMASQMHGSCNTLEHDNVDGYAKTTIYSTTAQTVTVSGGSDDGIIVYLNGEKVFEKLAHCMCYGPGQHTFDINLNAGANSLVVKLGERAGHWGFLLDIVGAEAKGISAAVSV